MNNPLDKRGYQGPERNRQLGPAEVVWARTEYMEGRVTPRQLSRQFGMGIESVRRMLRGDTYANIGEAIPRVGEAANAMEVNDGGAFERLIGQSPPLPVPSFGEPPFP